MADSATAARPLQQPLKEPLLADFFDAGIHAITTVPPVAAAAAAAEPASSVPKPISLPSQSRLSTPSPHRTPSPAELPDAAATQFRGYSEPAVPTIRHKSSQTWHHSGQATKGEPSPRLRPSPSPRSLSARPGVAHVQPLSLPVSASSGTGNSSNESSKPQSLMRRVSQKAANKLRRRAPSSAQNTHTERSGPVTLRNRSGSATGESGLGIQHHDSLDDEDESAAVDASGRPPGFESAAEDAAVVDKNPGVHRGSAGVVVPKELQRGTVMTRVTRKKKVPRTFKLNITSARVSWDDSKPTSRFYIDDMKEVRTGASARNYREELQVSSEQEALWITIVYIEPEHSKLKLLHVIAPDDHIFTIWTSTLEAINRYRTEMMAGLAMQGEKFVEAHWKKYMASLRPPSASLYGGPDRVTFEDVERLCRSIHVNCSRRFLKEKFKRADHDGSGYLNFQEFEEFVKLLKERDEIKELWNKLVDNKNAGMHINEFRKFLKDVQKVDITADSAHVDKVFRKFCRHSLKMNSQGRPLPAKGEEISNMRMDQEAFSAFLLSSTYNPPLLLAAASGQTLDRPLNEYYCSSSHNTYLMGRQLRGESSVEGYIKVLQKGCRCVEIDCWDGDDGRPVVTHGHTGTSQCLFSDVIATIDKYAFYATPYPVILSLEVHCSLEQQVKMANILVTILGDALVSEPFMTNSMTLPSPEELKNRILIKVKGAQRQESSLLKSDLNAMDNRLTASSPNPRAGAVIRSNTSSSAGTTSESEDQANGYKPKNVPKAARKIAAELGRLGVYCRGQKFRNFALPESKSFNHVFSFQEKKFIKFCKDPEKKVQLEKHNVRYMMRVYPSGVRINSSNFEPLGFWRRGVQMVALNWQTYDLGIQLNDAMFASGSDKFGYVLKPKSLRGSRNMFDPLGDAAEAKMKKEKKQIAFSIEVISAQQLPRTKDHKPDENIDPFVEVEVYSADDKAKGNSTGEGGVDLGDSKGISGLGAPQKRRTKVVRDDGFRPLFREKMKFSLVTKFEELVFLRFSMYSAHGGDDRVLIATYTAKLVSLQQGYRHLPLYDTQGEQYLFSTLFVKINVKPVTLVQDDAPTQISAIETLKTSAKSVLARGFSTDRRAASKRVDDSDPAGDGAGLVASPIAMTGPFSSSL